MEQKKYYVTTPIYYGTAAPHLGSLYSTLLADVIIRWHQLQKKETFFLTGTDEHGQKIAQAAEKVNKKPKEFVDSFIDVYKSTWQSYNIHYNNFIRTTDRYHIKAVQKWLQRLIDSGDIYKDYYTGLYCTPCETFITQKDTDKDQNFCPDCKRELNQISEECYFFKLSKYQDKLLQFYKDNADFIMPKERINEVLSFVKSGLKDLSISRTTISWGIPFPDDEKHVTYVWADALNNYITGVGYGQPEKEKDFNKWWPADVHVLGKDIVRFHAVYWPAFLMASNLELPKKLLVHGWININKQKMSKSFGNAVDPIQLKNDYGVDEVRYYLLRQMAVNQDGEFSIKDLEQRISSELANDLGNLLNRTISLAEKNNFMQTLDLQELGPEGLQLQKFLQVTIQEYKKYMESCSFHMALSSLWKFINRVNSFFHEQQPWKEVKKDKQLFEKTISVTCHSLYAIAILLWPVMPKKMETLLLSLGVTFSLDQININTLDKWDKKFMLKKIDTLFEKPEQKEEVKVDKISQEVKKNDYISFEDFIKVKIVVGTIESVEEVPKSDKLLKFQVDCGQDGKRQILSGVKKWYKPEDLVGKQGIFAVNLKPRKMMGYESQGMMIFAQNADGKQCVVAPVENVPSGVRLS